MSVLRKKRLALTEEDEHVGRCCSVIKSELEVDLMSAMILLGISFLTPADPLSVDPHMKIKCK